ncbi:serine/threonine-protein kinase [Nonomuraea rubra]|uniref:serine/threonine-protein kinase n=1 Tax=Nonomuraea rubra TaxID=46180 RepID=UPI00361DCC36
MPVIKPLRAGDPSEIGSYRLAGRLGASTYLGEPDDGERVVVKVLPADVDPGRFLEAVAPLQDVSAFCTAQVLGSGTLEDGRPFVVSEYIDGPTLREAVAAGQRLSDAALHRFAVGTVTALVALHQLGSAHGEVGPDTVVLGPDGPRVIGFGPARAMASTGAATTRTVDVPAFAAPERLQGAAAGPAADLFSWAATIAYASSGRSPFDGGSMAGTVNRIAHAEPELPELGDLRELVLACLDKDPARRPPASDVLLRLVGETSFLTGTVPGSGPDTDEPPGGEAPAPPPAPPQVAAAGRRRGTVLVAVAAFVAGAVLSGGGVYALTGQRGTPPARLPPPCPPPPCPPPLRLAPPCPPPPLRPRRRER